MKLLSLHNIVLFIALLFATSCTDSSVDKNNPYKPDGDGDDTSTEEVTYVDGFNYSEQTIDADKGLTITFKAAQSSPLYNYAGEVYLHVGVVVEGEWQGVPAAWDENIEKCHMKSVSANVWSIDLAPTIREWFALESVPIEKLGLVIRSSDGGLKGVESDTFVDVVDNLYEGFTPAAIVSKAVPQGLEYGINILSKSSVALVLYDKDISGSSHDYAHVVGDFNEWTLANDPSSQMWRDDAAGVWWIEVDGLESGREYAFQYYIGTAEKGSLRVADPYSEKILDPSNDGYIPASTYGESMEYPEGGIGILSVFETDPAQFEWQSEGVSFEDRGDMVIYELLIRDFTQSGDLAGVLSKLDYIEALGVNAIELMPVQEFDGNDSWGYNPAYFFAMDKAYGTRTAYKEFIDECHRRGIAVILDVVYNHATGAHPFARMWWDSEANKTSAQNPYFNVDAPHPYSVFHDFNHESELVREYVERNLEYLLTEYRFDGFRFDLTKGFTQKSSTENTASAYDQSRIDILKGYNAAVRRVNPSAIVILEHFCEQSEEAELAQDGMIVWRNANHAFCQAAMGYEDGSGFAHISTYGTSMVEDSYVGFMESHDEERMGFKQSAYSAEPLKTNMEVRMKQLATSAAFGLLAPGPKMIWQFGELGYDFSINHNQAGTIIDEGNRTGRKPIRWDYLDDEHRKGLYDNYARLLALRRAYPDLFEQAALQSWQVLQSDWSSGRYMSFVSGSKRLILMGNYTNGDIESTLTLPDADRWYNFASGAENQSGRVVIPANSYLLFTNFETSID